jgi:hypothetical protein
MKKFFLLWPDKIDFSLCTVYKLVLDKKNKFTFSEGKTELEKQKIQNINKDKEKVQTQGESWCGN